MEWRERDGRFPLITASGGGLGAGGGVAPRRTGWRAGRRGRPLADGLGRRRPAAPRRTGWRASRIGWRALADRRGGGRRGGSNGRKARRGGRVVVRRWRCGW